ncbi:BLUF domain-containing protein [Actimicrobium antarcticum]|uniref:BLUF domain-containing protein n=1 Tax=Actimicrobium antarcticum TaxID=1051899 RepID=A0ABP7SV23_9BURK
MLVRLLYASRSVDKISPEMVDSIMAQARTNNPPHGLTGILCFGGNIFVQVLEGGRTAVNTLYGDILRDPRHHDVQILHYEEITERRFAGWTMGQVNLGKLNTSVLLKYSELPYLNPFAVSGLVSMALLDELIATASIVGRA